jgi:HSP20 family molecular chaperone IbpA
MLREGSENKAGGDMAEENHMAGKSQSAIKQSVTVVEADVFDTMNETISLIAQRAYEIYESRGGGHGFDQDDWFRAEGELLPNLAIEYDVTDNAVRLTTQVPGFDARDLEVEVGHRRAVVCGIQSNSDRAIASNRKEKKVMQVVELPFDVDPVLAQATLQGGTLQVVLPRSL